MSPRVERLLWAVSAPGVLIALLVATLGSAPAPRRAAPSRIASAPAARSDTAGHGSEPALGELALEVVSHDPFRFERRPSEVPFGQEPIPDAPPPSRPPRPALQLSGISGPPLQAVLEGVPGHAEGVVARVGDTLAGLRVRAIRRDTVIVDGADTTWVLVLRRAW